MAATTPETKTARTSPRRRRGVKTAKSVTSESRKAKADAAARRGLRKAVSSAPGDDYDDRPEATGRTLKDVASHEGDAGGIGS
jgi:hypothetical protein